MHRRLRDGKEGARRRSTLHCGCRLVDRWYVRRPRADDGCAAARGHRAAVRAAGIHGSAHPRPDLPGLYVFFLADQDTADGMPRAATWYDRHRQHDGDFPYSFDLAELGDGIGIVPVAV